jgi:hypothetical protein
MKKVGNARVHLRKKTWLLCHVHLYIKKIVCLEIIIADNCQLFWHSSVCSLKYNTKIRIDFSAVPFKNIFADDGEVGPPVQNRKAVTCRFLERTNPSYTYTHEVETRCSSSPLYFSFPIFVVQFPFIST